MKEPEVKLQVGGSIYKGWKDVGIDRSLDAVAGAFTLSISEKWERDMRPWPILPGDECVVTCGEEAVVTGYVDRINPAFDAEDRSYGVSGRDKTADLVDCSAVVPSSEIRGQTIAGIARQVCEPFGISITAEEEGEIVTSHAVEPGETAFECLSRAAVQQGLVLTTDGRGNLVIAKKVGTAGRADPLVFGANLKEASAEYDFTNRHSEYTLKGTSGAPWEDEEKPKPQIKGAATDGRVKRYRPLILVGDMQATDASAGTRAEMEARKRAGESVKVRAVVYGWTQSDGRLWTLNATTTIDAPWLHLESTELIISSVGFRRGNDGTTTELELTLPDAWLETEGGGGKSGKGKKKGTGGTEYDFSLQ